jgi:hypothetical protein
MYPVPRIIREDGFFGQTPHFCRDIGLEHVSKKFLDFFDEEMLQLFEFERTLFDYVIPRDRQAL